MNSDNKKLDSKEVSKDNLDNVSGGYIFNLKNSPPLNALGVKKNTYVVLSDDNGMSPDRLDICSEKKAAQKAAAARGYSTKELNFKEAEELIGEDTSILSIGGSTTR